MRISSWLAAGGCGASLFLAGCTSLAGRIAEPRTDHPMFSTAFRDTLENSNGITRASFVASGGNRLVYRVVPAADYRMHYAYTRHDRRANFDFKVPNDPLRVERKGTVIFLHGWGDDHITMLPWALALARHGYVGILPDLRNHGESDRAPAGYGPREARDVVDLIVSLRQRGELQSPVYLFGVSYGATTAVFAAADPRANVDGVIAMEPFVNAGRGIRGMVAAMRSQAAGEAGHPLMNAYARHAYDAPSVDRAITVADTRLGLDLDAIDIGPLLQSGTTCTLLIEGTHDGFFDPADLRVFADAPRVRYLELPEENHLSLPMRIDLLGEPVADWIKRSASCPALPLPPEPVAPGAAH